MLTVKIICVGKLKEEYWCLACQEYTKRLGTFCRFSIVEISEERLPENPSAAQIEAGLKAEGKRILQAASGSAAIPLCIEGKELSSPQLAKRLADLALGGSSAVSFLIGSSFGLAEEVKQAGILRLSMSPMTFPHQLARVMLCEQIYRAFQINSHGKYHK